MIGVTVGLLMALANIVCFAIWADPVSLVAAAFCGLCALISAVVAR